METLYVSGNGDSDEVRFSLIDFKLWIMTTPIRYQDCNELVIIEGREYYYALEIKLHADLVSAVKSVLAKYPYLMLTKLPDQES
jgi:hypothetical protein